MTQNPPVSEETDVPTMKSNHPPAGYRPCVGVFLLNRKGRVFVARRNDLEAAQLSSGIAGKPWQMPQGGIDRGEAPATAAMREMREEIGNDRAALIGESAFWYSYDLPPEIARRKWGGKYRGQTQKWFALRFDGTDGDINLQTEHPEFDDWKWVSVDLLIDLVVPFKRQVYSQVLAEFRDLARELQQSGGQ